MTTLSPRAHIAVPLKHLPTARRGAEQYRTSLLLPATSMPTALGLCSQENDKPANCFRGFRTAHDYVSSHASECMWINISTQWLLIQIYMYVGMKTNKNCVCQGASSAQGCNFNCFMKSLENSNVLSWLSLVALVLLKIWFRGLTGLVQCQHIHYLFSSQVSTPC